MNSAQIRGAGLWLVAIAVACGGDDGGGADGEDGSSGIASFDNTGEAGSGPKLDLPGETDSGPMNPGDCPGQGGTPGEDYEFSIIWVSNTGEGTVSKIDTKTAQELARYQTGPLDNPDPSRTSVNLVGDVAIANRSGSITKIASERDRCKDGNGNGTIETSSAPADVLAWGEDECVLWHHDVEFPQGLSSNQGGPRAIAWDANEGNDPCAPNPGLWIGWRNQPDETVTVRRLDGRTGEELGEALVPDWEGNWGHGTYGGAADADGAFWGLGTLGTLIKIEPESFAVTRWDNPAAHVMYGIALDANGDPWLAGYDGNLWWFDRETEAFNDMGAMTGGPSRLRGLAIDSDGHAWIAGNSPCFLSQYDTVAKTLVNAAVALPGCGQPVGVSIDVDGMVWVVDRDANIAYKVDPDTYDAVTVPNLVAPYTYSDMTGAGLGLVVNPPAG